ncbi:MAG: threonine synthase [Firmicutes bacterium]|nr:threonine synthase [Bacillota bacterium]
MDYCSTRGKKNEKRLYSAAEAVLMGLAPDGGLFVPAAPWPPVSLEQLTARSYPGLAAAIIQPFLEQFSAGEINVLLQKAYGGGAFDHPMVVPLHRLTDNLYFMELWHGPTCAFKDLALQFLPHLLHAASVKVGGNSTTVLLVATSGDTGKAALEGFRDLPGTKVIVFYPLEGVSEVQKQQMITQEGANLHVAAVRGNFDHAQAGVKALLGDRFIADRMARRGLRFSTANSINWGRLLPQIVYYFSAYLELRRTGAAGPAEKINFVVPTGNFGNILAAFYAFRMGLPVNRLICAANRNRVLTDFISEGHYSRNRPFYRTISPSMDILASSNLERLLYELTGRDAARISEWMRLLRKEGAFQIGPELKKAVGEIFWSHCADDGETLNLIRETYLHHRYLLDPHTAVGLAVYEKYRSATGDSSKTIIAATASPFKFAESVVGALLPPDRIAGQNAFQLLPLLAEATGLQIPAPLQDLDLLPPQHRTIIDKDGIRGAVLRYLDLEE